MTLDLLKKSTVLGGRSEGRSSKRLSINVRCDFLDGKMSCVHANRRQWSAGDVGYCAMRWRGSSYV